MSYPMGEQYPRPFIPTYAKEDDLSDVSLYYQQKSPTAETQYTLLDLSNGPRIFLNHYGGGYSFTGVSGGKDGTVELTVDGVTTDQFPEVESYVCENENAYLNILMASYPIRYDETLRLRWIHKGTGCWVTMEARVLGSGPHSIAVVREGEPVYMQARNLSDDDIESLEVPSGYQILKNPEIDHPNPQTLGMWDGEKVVDHPYWRPFHDKLRELNSMRTRHGAAVREKVEKSERLPGDVDLEWPLPEDHEERDPEGDAMEWWLKDQKRPFIRGERRELPRLEDAM